MPFDFEKLDKDCEKEIAIAKSKKQKLKPTHWITLSQYKVKITFLGSLTSIDIYNKNDIDNCLPLGVEVIDKKNLRGFAYKILEIYGDKSIKLPPKDILKNWVRKKKIKRFGKNVDEIADEILELLAEKK